MPSHRKTAAWPLTLAYVALVIYASLYPFDNWRNQGVLPWAYLTQPLPNSGLAHTSGLRSDSVVR